MTKERFRTEGESVYEWDESAQAYVFIGKLNGEPLDEWLDEYLENYDTHNPND